MVFLMWQKGAFFPSKCHLMGSCSSAFPLVNCMWMCQGWCPILCCSDWHLEICRSLAGWWFLSKYLTAVNTTSTTYLEEKALQKWSLSRFQAGFPSMMLKLQVPVLVLAILLPCPGQHPPSTLCQLSAGHSPWWHQQAKGREKFSSGGQWRLQPSRKLGIKHWI